MNNVVLLSAKSDVALLCEALVHVRRDEQQQALEAYSCTLKAPQLRQMPEDGFRGA